MIYPFNCGIITKKKLLYFFSVHAITNLSKKIRTFFELIEFTIEKKIFSRYTNGTKWVENYVKFGNYLPIQKVTYIDKQSLTILRYK
jgi:hypothetical protein